MKINRLNIVLKPSHDRVIIRSFIPSNEERIYRIIARIISLSEDQVAEMLKKVLREFEDRHQNIQKVLLNHFEKVKNWLITDLPISIERKILIGSYFTQEYSIESAALFNPSIIPHPDQSDIQEGSIRFIMSLRATGEGHISSIVFREGIIDKNFKITIRKPTPYVTEPERVTNTIFEKDLFIRKLRELELDTPFARNVLSTLEDSFNLETLLAAVENQKKNTLFSGYSKENIDAILTFTYSNYEVQFNKNQRTSERAIFPSSPSQKNGIEDARFVLFTEDDGSKKYYATYTAYDGKTIIPQLLETEDFFFFRFVTLNGSGVQNKGMALFPRKINGNYVMLSRQDNENIFIMYSDNIHFWYNPKIIIKPTYPWEYTQLGNCGSPLETDEGWLVLSHGVGPMRKYCIGAFLLDKNDPSKVIGRLKKPLIKPNENEREGYVPNVVYTCGALIHQEKLIIPYAISDYATSFALVDVKKILNAMD